MPVQKKSILTVTAPAVLILLMMLVVSACAVSGGTDAAQASSDTTASLADELPEPLPEAGSQPEEVTAAMTADEMYRVMSAELQGSDGDIIAALSNYLEAALLSDDPKIAKRVTVLSARARSWQHAAMAANRWQVLDPNNIEATRTLAAAHIFTGNYKAAAYQLDHLYTQVEGTEAEKWQHITGVLARSASTENARDLLQQLIDKYQLNGNTPAVATGKLAQSQLAAKLGDMPLAMQLGQEAALGLKDDAQAQLWVGRLFIASEKLPESTRYFQRAWEINPTEEEIAMAYAEVLHRQDNTVKANTVLAGLAQTDRVLLNRIVFATVERDQPRAERLFHQMEDSVDRDQPSHAMRMARAADLIGLPAEARSWYARVPESAEAWLAARLRLAVLVAISDGLEQGRAVLTALKNNQDTNVVEQAWLADTQLLQQAQQPEAAAESLRSGLLQQPDSVPLNYSLGLLMAQAGDVAAAEELFRKVLSLQPNNPTALNALGYTLTDLTDRHAEALGYIQRALELQPDDVSVIDSMGWVLYRLGRNTEALVYLKQAYLLDDNPEIAAHLVEVLWKSGQLAAAKALFNKARAESKDDPILLKTGQRLGL